MNQNINAIIFGASGMVGQGVLQECLKSNEVENILMVNRYSLGITHPKLKEVIHSDFTDFSPISEQLSGYNACYFSLGISAAGLSEAAYKIITYDYTLAAAHTLVKLIQT